MMLSIQLWIVQVISCYLNPKKKVFKGLAKAASYFKLMNLIKCVRKTFLAQKKKDRRLSWLCSSKHIIEMGTFVQQKQSLLFMPLSLTHSLTHSLTFSLLCVLLLIELSCLYFIFIIRFIFCAFLQYCSYLIKTLLQRTNE